MKIQLNNYGQWWISMASAQRKIKHWNPKCEINITVPTENIWYMYDPITHIEKLIIKKILLFFAFKKAITFSNTCPLSLSLCPNCLKHDLCVVRSQPMGWHWEAELLPQVGGGAAAGHSLTADLHQCGATQPNNSTVSPISDISENVIPL